MALPTNISSSTEFGIFLLTTSNTVSDPAYLGDGKRPCCSLVHELGDFFSASRVPAELFQNPPTSLWKGSIVKGFCTFSGCLLE